jgi:hypothetical protein
MTFQFSQRGQEYFKAAQRMLRAAQAMADQAIAGHLKALADDSQRRAEKASYADAVKAFAVAGCAASHAPFIRSLPPAGRQS